MLLPASLREINPLIDRLARRQLPPDGPGLGLAVALGLATPDGGLTAAGLAYACPDLPEGPAARVMSARRRSAAAPLVSGPLPLQRSLRRLLAQVVRRPDPLVSPQALGWPESLLRPYLTYLEDLGLLWAIGPLVEATPAGRALAEGNPAGPPVWAEWQAPDSAGPATPSFRSAAFRYHLERRVALWLVALRGRREWHRLQPLLDGPLASLAPAYAEWLARFRTFLPPARRAWAPDQVEEFAAIEPEPAWFADWCQTLLGVEPDEAAAVLAKTPWLLNESPALVDGLPDRAAWLVAAALGWAARHGRTLDYARASARLAADGLPLPPWPELRRTLEAGGLLVATADPAGPEVHLVTPVDVWPPPSAIWPYGSTDWVAAALTEGACFGRRPVRSRPGDRMPVRGK